MTKFELYFLTRIEDFKILLMFSAGVFLFGFILFHINQYMEDNRNIIGEYKKTFITLIVIFFCGFALPSTKDIAIIYGLNYLTNNQDAKNIPDNVLKVINKELQEVLEDKK